jgi:hypothetical protein
VWLPLHRSVTQHPSKAHYTVLPNKENKNLNMCNEVAHLRKCSKEYMQLQTVAMGYESTPHSNKLINRVTRNVKSNLTHKEYVATK